MNPAHNIFKLFKNLQHYNHWERLERNEYSLEPLISDQAVVGSESHKNQIM